MAYRPKSQNVLTNNAIIIERSSHFYYTKDWFDPETVLPFPYCQYKDVLMIQGCADPPGQGENPRWAAQNMLQDIHKENCIYLLLLKRDPCLSVSHRGVLPWPIQLIDDLMDQ